MTYNKQNWQSRYATMGDVAEGVFEEVAPLGKHERFGFNRPPFKLGRLSPFIRHTPDYITGTGHLVEVMGCGRDSIVKLKVEKYEALKDWQKFGAVALFLWNSATQEWALIQWEQIKKLFGKGKRDGGVEAFDDGNEYVGIHWDWLELVYPYER